MIRRPSKVTDASAVVRAIKKCDQMGRSSFREHYGYGASKEYFLRYRGKTYDSKAILGVAYGFQHGLKPLQANEFSGGAARVQPVLKALGFAVVRTDAGDNSPIYTSEWLSRGEIYTREVLRDIFGITDASINNGVFRPKNSSSIWLFVTEKKTPDRPQLVDLLSDDVLHWQGQPAGRTDTLIAGHLDSGNELLVFYRITRDEYPSGGFRFEGNFLYKTHSGKPPKSFIMVRDLTDDNHDEAYLANTDDADEFNPRNIADGRKKTLALVKLRQGQGKFRKALLHAYSGKCAITGCDFEPILEAAHIHPYRGVETNKVSNGILLRADLHTLFDLGMITINEDGTLNISPKLVGTDYAKLQTCTFPLRHSNRPSRAALKFHRELINIEKTN